MAACSPDGTEAEIATSPVVMRPGFTGELGRLVRVEHGRLVAHVGPSVQVQGWSTHLNVEVADGTAVSVALRLATRFAPALMLLMDRRESPGLLVRPRPSRIELGGEYLVGDQLRAAMLMAAAATLVCERPASGRPVRRALPPALRLDLQPARALRALMSTAPVRRRLVRTRKIDRNPNPLAPHDHRTDAPRTLLGDGPGSGRIHCPARGTGAARRDGRRRSASAGRAAFSRPDTVATCAARARRRRARPGDPSPIPGGGLRGHLVVHRVSHLRQPVAVCVRPAHQLSGFHGALRDGGLDGILGRAMAAEGSDRVLRSSDQTGDIGVFDRIGDPADLTPAERDPGTGQPFGGGGGRAGRQAKRRAGPPPISRANPARRIGPVVIVAAVLVALIAVGGVAVAVSGGGSEKRSSAAAKTTTSASLPTTTTGPFRPSAAQMPTVRLSGTYDLVRTVVKSNNITAPVGTKERRVYRVSNTCTGTPPCAFAVRGATASDALSVPFDGHTYTLDSRTAADCYDSTTGKTVVKGGGVAIFHQELRATEVEVRHRVLIATKLSGTAFLTAEARAGSTCSEIRPITYAAVAALRGSASRPPVRNIAPSHIPLDGEERNAPRNVPVAAFRCCTRRW